MVQKLISATAAMLSLSASVFAGTTYIYSPPPYPTPPLEPRTWTHDGGGSWSSAANWDGTAPNSYTISANFQGALSAPNAPALVNLDGYFSVGGLTFDSSNPYEITGDAASALFLGKSATLYGWVNERPASDSPGPLHVVQGTHRISVALTVQGNAALQVDTGATLDLSGRFASFAGSTITFSGGGRLVLSGLQAHSSSANLTVSAGRVELNRNLGEAINFGFLQTPHPGPVLRITGAADVVLGANQEISALRVEDYLPGAQGFDLNSPPEPNAFRSVWMFENSSEDWNKVVKASLHQSIAHARDNPGDGIFDSGMRGENSALGVAFIQHPDGPYGFLIRPTRIGDLNLDGFVTIADFIDLASHFGESGPTITWQEGDVNYDSAVTIADFIDLAANFGSSYSAAVNGISSADLAVLSDFAISHGLLAVPEPSILLLILGIGLLPRRCR
jgi:hypothetical protein